MRYGYFDDQACEYVITNPKTPVKWINYIGTLAFGGFVDHTGGALLCKNDPSLNRITKYFAQLPASEFKGETLYLRMKRGLKYRLFSPFFVPCLAPYERFECHVGLGYTRIVSRTRGIEVDATIFVPLNGACELRDIRITNCSKDVVELDAIPVVEYTHFDALKQLTNADWVPQTMQSRAVAGSKGRLILTQFAFMHKDTAINYFTSNLPVSSFETDRRSFLGENEYGTWAAPGSLQLAELNNSQAERGDNIGALMMHLGVIEPGETRRLVTQLGQESSLAAAMRSIEIYRQPEQVDAAFSQLAASWQERLGRIKIDTPDAALNSMLNVHNPRQCYITLNWSRYLSLYQLGFGSRGIGFRDSSQDTLGIMPYAPEESKSLLTRLLQVQKCDGSAMHQFNPLTMIASIGDAAEWDDRPHFYSDDALWIILGVTAYLKETGDMAFLDQVLPYYEKDRAGEPVMAAPVLDHLCQALEFTHDNRGAHGLPLLGFADWNDTVNLPPGSESVFSACLFGRALLEMIELAGTLKKDEMVARFKGYYHEMKEILNERAWDGEWYVTYFDDKGHPLGSKENEAGQLYAYSQAWAVISGFARGMRAKIALDSIFSRLNTRNGIKLSTPGFKAYDPEKGGITTYPPGAKENGGIFLHVNPWVIMAEAMLGHGERVYAYYSQINPAAKNERIEEYECEPYVYPQNILGDEHSQFGLARNSWLSGTASWMELVGTQYLLGIQPAYDGLKITPCIPKSWDKIEVVRRFRQSDYQIIITNPDHVCSGVKLLVIDGKVQSSQLVPILPPGRHKVEVILGKADNV